MSGTARLGLVTAVLVVGLGAAAVTAPETPRTAVPQSVPVLSAWAVCPDVPAGTTLATGGAGSAAVSGGPLGQPPAALVPGEVDPPGPGEVPYVVSAQGDGAAGLVVTQATRTPRGTERGLAVLACPAPGTSSWFVGGATTVGATTELLLVNVEDAPALVDVRVWTAEGPADPRPGRGIVVGPRSRLVVPLDRLAPDRDLLALHVATTRGRTAAAVRTSRRDGRTPLGTDWLPPTAPPAREAVVPGLPSGPGSRSVLVTNPGDVDAAVQVGLTTDDGQLAPVPLTVRAGSSVALDVSEQLRGSPAAARVVSDGPAVVAGAVVVDEQRAPVRERSYAAAVPALGDGTFLEPAGVPAAQLLLTALVTDAVVEVAGRRVEVPGATTVAVDVEASTEVQVVAGEVHAGWWSRESGRAGLLTGGLPLRPVVRTALRPVVVADPGAGR